MRASRFILCSFLLITLTVACESKKTFPEDLAASAIGCDVEGIKRALAKGADVNAVGENGYTVLHLVFTMLHKYESFSSTEESKKREAKSESRRIEYIPKARVAVATLLEAGANPNVKTDIGRTPLMLAAEAGDEEIVFLLIKAGADLKARDKYDHDAAYLAFMAGNKELGAALRDLASAQPTSTPAATPVSTPTQTPSKLRERVMTEVWGQPSK
jgi:ankyrin repeat protein